MCPSCTYGQGQGHGKWQGLKGQIVTVCFFACQLGQVHRHTRCPACNAHNMTAFHTPVGAGLVGEAAQGMDGDWSVAENSPGAASRWPGYEGVSLTVLRKAERGRRDPLLPLGCCSSCQAPWGPVEVLTCAGDDRAVAGACRARTRPHENLVWNRQRGRGHVGRRQLRHQLGASQHGERRE